MQNKLYYFDARGLCEPIRMILAIGGVEYEDFRFPLDKVPPAVPAEIKEKCNWGQVPLMEFEGKKLCQSLAIGRYFAKKFKLVGADDFESALCDEYVDSSREILQAWVPVFIEKEPEKKDQLKEEITKKMEEKFLNRFESLIEANGGDRLVGKKLTWADISLAHVVNNIEIVAGVNLAKKYPNIQSLCNTVFAIPEIKAWVAKRPKTVF